ncbi:MAG: hypothetical protein IJR14_08625 [Synergistaceae bacterium]|nr:hypothetical protein [Synergistaceae bacterium]
MKKFDRIIAAFYAPYHGAGKTTAARGTLSDGTPRRVLSFAGPLYDIVCSIARYTGVTKKHGIYLNDYKDKHLPELGGASIRDFLNGFGAKGREIYPDIWAEHMRGQINSYPNKEMSVVIDDLRFPNEYAMLREEGAKIIRITVPGRPIIGTETEALLEDREFDYELVNTMDGLSKLIDSLELMARRLWPERMGAAT